MPKAEFEASMEAQLELLAGATAAHGYDFMPGDAAACMWALMEIRRLRAQLSLRPREIAPEEPHALDEAEGAPFTPDQGKELPGEELEGDDHADGEGPSA